MNWSCVKCGHPNPNSEQHCQKCGARLPFRPPTETAVPEEATETFRVPVRGELTALLYQGIEQLRGGSLLLEEFQQRIETALETVPSVFSAILDEVQESSEELTAYGDGVCVSLLDCQALFESGLNELLHFTEDQDDFHLRFGWLLLEKAETEYVQILKTLQRDAQGRPFDGADNVVGRLYADLLRGTLNDENYQAELRRFEEVSLDRLEDVGTLLSKGVALASKKETHGLQDAMELLQEASDKLGKVLLNLYAVEEIETAG